MAGAVLSPPAVAAVDRRGTIAGCRSLVERTDGRTRLRHGRRAAAAPTTIAIKAALCSARRLLLLLVRRRRRRRGILLPPPHFDSVCLCSSGITKQVVKVIVLSPHRYRARIIQSFSPGGANVPSRSVWPFARLRCAAI